MNSYPPGNTVRLTANCLTAGVLADPGTIVCIVESPNGTPASSVPVRDAAGTYHLDVDVETPGTWQYAFKATGSGKAAAEARFFVETSQIL